MLLPYYKADDDYNYIDTFDKKWINQHNLYLCGPKYCNNCRTDGMIGDIFIGYCMDCSIIIFCGERGQGIKSNYTLNEWRYWLKLPEYLIKYENILYKYFYDERITQYVCEYPLSKYINKKTINKVEDVSTIVEKYSDNYSLCSENTNLINTININNSNINKDDNLNTNTYEDISPVSYYNSDKNSEENLDLCYNYKNDWFNGTEYDYYEK